MTEATKRGLLVEIRLADPQSWYNLEHLPIPERHARELAVELSKSQRVDIEARGKPAFWSPPWPDERTEPEVPQAPTPDWLIFVSLLADAVTIAQLVAMIHQWLQRKAREAPTETEHVKVTVRSRGSSASVEIKGRSVEEILIELEDTSTREKGVQADDP